ncbi:MAG: T9SS type A sorting domain-containing protein [Bacteroidia bacterium]|nr:T9SS type A sorting domain-containing protein [Bacteroidia bacterium]
MQINGIISTLINQFTSVRLAILFMLCSGPYLITAQKLTGEQVHPILFKDSLEGFDIEAATKLLKQENYLEEEYIVKLNWLKRSYINDKFNIWPLKLTHTELTPFVSASIFPGCNNEDFEASNSGTITSQNQINGWTISRGSVLPPNSACNLSGCCGLNPSESILFYAPMGYIDPNIGACYPIYSVFGTIPGNLNGPIHNPHIQQPMQGNNFIRINSSSLGSDAYSVEKLSKTIQVTPNNALFQFAYIFVTSTAHSCCSAAAFQFKFTNLTTNSIIACPGYSITGPSTACLGYTTNNLPFLNSGTCTAATINSSPVFNKWQVIAIDFTPNMGQTVEIEIIASDCDASAHYGYAYVDAQCGPFAAYVNNQAIYSNSVLVMSCDSPAVLSVPIGFFNYSWTGPSGFTANTSSVSAILPGTYVVNMNNGATCSSSSMTIQLGFGGNALSVNSSNSTLCIGQTATLSAGAMNSYTWNTGSNNQNIIVSPVQSTTYIVAATDASNCIHTASLSIYVSSPSISILSTDSTICLGEAVLLSGTGAQTYAWSNGASGSTISVSPSVDTVYTVSGTDSYGCITVSPGFTIWVSPCLGTKESESISNWVELFPNPNQGTFDIQMKINIKNVKFKLFSEDGRLIYTQNVLTGINKVNIENISPGIYFYIISSSDQELKKGKIQVE